MAKTKSISVTLDTYRIAEIDRWVDGTQFRNRSHLIDSVLKEWLEFQARKGKGEQTTIFNIKSPVKVSKKKGEKTK